MLRFAMKQKNSFSVVVFIDNEGKVEIDGSELLRMFNNEQSAFPMDYVDPSTGFSGHITANILGQPGIQEALRAYQLYKTVLDYPPGYESALVNAKDQTIPESDCTVTIEQADLQQTG